MIIKTKKKSIYKSVLEFIGVYMLSMFLAVCVTGYVPKEKERFYFSSMIITLVIFGAYEAGRKNPSIDE